MIFKKANLVIFISLLSIVLLMSLSSVSADDQNASDTYASIYNAIQNVGVGETVYLTENVQYEGSGYDNGIFITKGDFTLDGNGYTINGTSSNGIRNSVFSFGGSNIIIKNLHITSAGRTDINGGAIRNYGINNTLTDVNISYCIGRNGGAIYNSGSNFTISGNCNFYNNTASSYGGAINNFKGDYFKIIGNNIIENNSASFYGGGIYNNIGSNFLIDGNNIIRNNRATNGAGITNDGTAFENRLNINYQCYNFTIRGSNQIVNNIATYNGGGIYNLARFYADYYSASNFTIIGNNKIANNSADNNGGGIYNYYGPYFGIYGNNEIINNTANDNGGAIYNDNGLRFNIANSNNFNNNSANIGGAIYNDGEIFINGNYFIDNAGNGTAIFNNKNLTLKNGYFQHLLTDNDHFVYNNGILFLDKNIMNSSHYEKIFNAGNITSEVLAYYIEGKVIVTSAGHIVPLNVTLTDDNGNNIVGQAVTLQVEDLLNHHEIDVFFDGYHHSVNLTVTHPGSFIVNGTYYKGGNNLTIINGIIKVLLLTESQINGFIAKIGDTVTITGTVIDQNGNLVNGDGILTLANGQSVNVTIKDGKFSYIWAIPYEAQIGNGTVSIKYNGNETHHASSATNTTLINKLETIITINNVTGKIADIVTITGTVVDEKGNNITGEVVLTLVNGEKVTVNAKDGKFTYEWTIPNGIKPGNYDNIASYNGDRIYESSSSKGIATILKLKTTTTINDVTGKAGENVLITGTVVDEKGNNVNGKIDLTLADGSKVIVNVIDGKFEYFWTIPQGFKNDSYQIIAEFNENDYYFESNAIGNLIVVSEDNIIENETDPEIIEVETPNESLNNFDNIALSASKIEKTGNPIAILILALIFSLILPLKRRF